MSVNLPAGGTASAPGDLDATYQKVFWRLIPILMILWVLAWIDRVNVSFAKLQMMEELQFSDAVYGLGAGIFYIGYLVFEVPSNLLLQKIGARKTIARIAIGWGVICMLMAHATTPALFYTLRFLLGAFEAGFFPGVIMYLTLWFPTERRAKVFGIFMSSVALSGVIGGPLAGSIMTHLHGYLGTSGWQWLFLLEGMPTVLIGLFVLKYLTDKVEDAHWLTTKERLELRADLDRDSKSLGERQHSFALVLRDRRLWIFTAVYFLVIVMNATAAFWGPTIVREAGFDNIATIGWIISGVSLCGSAAMIFNGLMADRTQRPLAQCVGSIVVGGLAFVALAMPIHDNALLTIAAFAFALAGAYGAIPVFWQMPNKLFAGTAAAAGIAIINSFGNLGGFLAPYGLGLLKTETGSVASGLLTVGVLGLSAALVLVLAVQRFMNIEAQTMPPESVSRL
ncbi:sugar phosphate permease [Rhizobium subbaraonis]|uniref:Sugar phosphate permease n=1 Tax=Rhizobium subbaraonis TaxID=908946 RepID=A0A285V6S5_9HYPH|nr:MFS transporter [Rhizobium subbaraonis]SOC48231.1 sugar phosphate permease [Rhizobium subbaraonis]